MKKLLAVAALVATFAGVAPAMAVTVVNIPFSGTGTAVNPGDVTFSGFFTANYGSGLYSVTGVTGTQTYAGVTSTITGLSSYAGADELLFGTLAPLPDFSGVSFSTAANGDFNLFTSGGNFELSSNVDPVGYPQNGIALRSLTISGVPEPATWGMLILGFSAVGWSLRGRRTQAAVAA